jgi:hypothetical protein
MVKELISMYRVRSCIQNTVNCQPSDLAESDLQEKVAGKLWTIINGWELLPEGVVTIIFDNGIELRRPGEQIDGSEWDLDDLNVYFDRRYRTKVPLVPWGKVVPRTRR